MVIVPWVMLQVEDRHRVFFVMVRESILMSLVHPLVRYVQQALDLYLTGLVLKTAQRITTVLVRPTIVPNARMAAILCQALHYAKIA